MTEQYTPTVEDVQSYYVAGRAQLRRQVTGEQAIEITRYSHEFDRWLAEVERAAAARALDDAAYGIFVSTAEIDPGKRMAFHRGADAVYDALRARAAEIRERAK